MRRVMAIRVRADTSSKHMQPLQVPASGEASDRRGPVTRPWCRRSVRVHIRDGKILEDAIMTDALAILQQLGVAPSA
jgi:hypothetical protein